jgi:hypothetical protein
VADIGQGIAPTLIVARVTAVDACSDQSWLGRAYRTESFPQFNYPNGIHSIGTPATSTTVSSEGTQIADHQAGIKPTLGDDIV